MQDWKAIFSALGQTFSQEATGCCGMSGTYGHEAKNVATSKHIYQLSWGEIVKKRENQGKLMATGYSCRSQVKREDEIQLPHPLQVLLQQSK